jgi:hypothetical protein
MALYVAYKRFAASVTVIGVIRYYTSTKRQDYLMPKRY